jgi:UDP-N-acetylmuramate dehydrogenase
MTDVYETIESIPGVAARKDELLSHHTSLGVGGPCDLMVWISEIPALARVIDLAKAEGIPFMVLGSGSNVLVRDGGIDGMVLRLVDDFARIEIDSARISAGAGARLAEVVSRATAGGIGGFEFLSGIPGSVGGAVAGNAGSADEWISQRLTELYVLDEGRRERTLAAGEIEFGYRRAAIPAGFIVTGAAMEGFSTDVESVRHMVEERLEARRLAQPVGEKTAGCIFKNPPDGPAGKLIDEAGLKGARVGGAEVSTMHANYLVNRGEATAREVLELIQVVRTRVKDSYGVDLELEIRVIGKN